MRAICYKCDHEWDYRGKQRGNSFMSCPKCSYKLRADKVLVPDLHSVQGKLHSLDDFKPKIHNKIHTYIHNFERVYFPNGFDCLVHKDIAAQFKELTLEDLQDEEEEKTPEPGIEPGVYVDQFGEKITITPIKQDQVIITIPRDPIKLLEHQRNFF